MSKNHICRPWHSFFRSSPFCQYSKFDTFNIIVHLFIFFTFIFVHLFLSQRSIATLVRRPIATLMRRPIATLMRRSIATLMRCYMKGDSIHDVIKYLLTNIFQVDLSSGIFLYLRNRLFGRPLDVCVTYGHSFNSLILDSSPTWKRVILILFTPSLQTKSNVKIMLF